MPINYLTLSGDPAAQQVFVVNTADVSLISPLAVATYELTTDGVQSATQYMFKDSLGATVGIGVIRGGKGFVTTTGIASYITVSSGTFPLLINIRQANPNSATILPVPIEYFVIGGGGGGGGTNGSDYASNGGGGAGGYLTGTVYAFSTSTLTVTVGAGGNGQNSTNSWAGSTKGGQSSIVGTGISVIADGGGKGQEGYGNSSTGANYPGGSGGGGSAGGWGGVTTGIGIGFMGGSAKDSYGGAGGGGASEAGVTIEALGINDGRATRGGNGVSSSITGSAVTYGGGGGGGWSPYYGTANSNTNRGGTGGGGQGGGGGNNYVATSGTVNTGSGGGAGGAKATTGTNQNGGNGGSGVAIIRYPNTYSQASATTGSPTYSTSGGYHIYKFTGTGTITL